MGGEEMRETTYDVVLYGASGFVGKQTVRYSAERVRLDEVRWAIAGRDRQKLELVGVQIGIDVDILLVGVKLSSRTFKTDFLTSRTLAVRDSGKRFRCRTA